MIMHIGYSEGYTDALRDIFCWFDNHRHLFKGQMGRLVIALLRHFMDNRTRFFRDKECYELEIFIPKDKKKPIEVKQGLSDEQ